MIIAIDGHSGAGKSTLGKMLAEELNLLYLDTGAMYRAVGLAVLNNGCDEKNQSKIIEIARNTKIDMVGEPANLSVLVNGRDVSGEIRKNKVGRMASIISTISEIRRDMVKRQQGLGESAKNGVVLSGRDIGTVVFPNADIKFFLTAEIEVRAKRRYKEDLKRGAHTSFMKTLDDIDKRDERDENRSDSPLRITKDAIVIDTGKMNKEEVLSKTLKKISELKNVRGI